MNSQNIINVLLISIIIIILALLVFNLVIYVNEKRVISTLNAKKKKERKKKQILLSKNKKIRNRIIKFFILELIVLGGFVFYYNYQNSNMTNTDSDLLVRGYFLVDDFTNELEKASAKTDSEDASVQNTKYLALSMASYSNKTSDSSNTVEGQQLLNKYYKMIGQLGMNATKDSSLFYGNQQNIKEQYTSDLKRIKDIENQVFEYYKVNANALSNK
ncbi:hypothetical protein JNUCC83_09085 [Vagococcus sp. JNUCC 83]